MAISGRVEGGEEVVPHSIPWQVTIFDQSGDFGNDIAGCGGTLISSKHVLTAAHCAKEDQNCARYSVGVGMHKDNVTDGTRVLIYLHYLRLKIERNYPQTLLNTKLFYIL